MSRNLYLVFSKPPEGLSPAEYDRWYHHHIRENIETPGFVAGQRYGVQAVVPSGGGDPPGFSHLALYEYDGDIMSLRTALDERREAGEIVLPEWFPRIGFGTWDCIAIDDRVVTGR